MTQTTAVRKPEQIRPPQWWKPGQSGNPKGKPAGTIQGRLLELRDRAKKTGCDPLDVMMFVIRELMTDAAKVRPREYNPDGSPLETEQDRIAALKEAEHEKRTILLQANGVAGQLAPYMHPRLQSIELGSDPDRPLVLKEDADRARDRLAQMLVGMAAVRAGLGSSNGGAGEPQLEGKALEIEARPTGGDDGNACPP